jgi:hypothetical protein
VSRAAIIGLAVGLGVAGLALLAVGLAYCCSCRRRASDGPRGKGQEKESLQPRHTANVMVQMSPVPALGSV